MKIKGNSLVVVPELIRKKYGEEGLKKWFENIREEAVQAYSSIINPSEWYDLSKYYLEPVQVYCNLFCGGDFSGAFEMGEADADNSLKGVYRIFIQMGSPEFLIKKAVILFPTYYKNAKMNIIEISKGKSILEISDFGGIKMKEINKYTISGWMHKAMNICGIKNVEVNFQENNGNERFIIIWS